MASISCRRVDAQLASAARLCAALNSRFCSAALLCFLTLSRGASWAAYDQQAAHQLPNDDVVVSRYVANPLLIDGFKCAAAAAHR